MKGQDVLFSSKSDEWATPQYFYDWLDSIYHFTLDPCASDDNHKCEKYFTIETDGLKQPWTNEVAFVNPPYSDIGVWCQKAYTESLVNSSTVVLLIPSRTDTDYWHRHVMKASKIGFVKGRLKFGDSKNSAPFPSCIVIFQPDTIKFKAGDDDSDIITFSINLKQIKENYDR